jgi:hypothetical protein
MITIQTLDISTDRRSPVRIDRRSATRTTRLIRKSPCKNRSARAEAAHNRLDIFLALRLDNGICIPGFLCSAILRVPKWHSTVVTPIVDEWDDEFHAVFFGGFDDGV